MEYVLILAVIIGFIKGFMDNKDSFWYGFGKGLSSNDIPENESIYISYRDRKSGIGIGTKINSNKRG